MPIRTKDLLATTKMVLINENITKMTNSWQSTEDSQSAVESAGKVVF